jgi:proteasome lid subunit RPN8/RPN11
MIRIEADAWRVMIGHAEAAYPRECCGVMLGQSGDGERSVTIAVPCRNVYEGDQKDRFTIHAGDLNDADKKARELGLDVVGMFHSHPDCDAYFSATDLANSWPVYSNVVLSVQGGRFDHAKSFITRDWELTQADPEDISYPN